MDLNFTIDITEDAGSYMVTCPDIPELLTAGDSRVEAMAMAQDALDEWLAHCIASRLPLPVPGTPPKAGQAIISPSLTYALKAAIHQAMLDEKVTRVELGRRMGRAETQVRRILDVTTNTRLPDLEAALQALGRSVRLDISRAS